MEEIMAPQHLIYRKKKMKNDIVYMIKAATSVFGGGFNRVWRGQNKIKICQFGKKGEKYIHLWIKQIVLLKQNENDHSCSGLVTICLLLSLRGHLSGKAAHFVLGRLSSILNNIKKNNNNTICLLFLLIILSSTLINTICTLYDWPINFIKKIKNKKAKETKRRW